MIITRLTTLIGITFLGHMKKKSNEVTANVETTDDYEPVLAPHGDQPVAKDMKNI